MYDGFKIYPMKEHDKNHIERSREHLANERTFLSWIRTSIALMGFGFVIVKFSMFLGELSLILKTTGIPAKGYSPVIGIIMVAVGVIILIPAFIQYKKNEKRINHDYYVPASGLSLFITLVILFGGIFIIYYLLSIL